MIFSTRAEYGLRVMVELALTYGQGPVALADIAQAQALSPGYLEQLVARLRRAGLLVATRGAKGGYQLTTHPATITMGQVLRSLEGPLEVTECASEVQPAATCQKEATCSSRRFWLKLQDSLAEVLNSTTLADLCPTPPSQADRARAEAVAVGPGKRAS